MRRALPALLTLLVLTAVPAPAGAIVGGQPVAREDQVPWQVAVLPDGFLCGGSIIDATHVVTAAHCTEDGAGLPIAAADIEVRAGSIRLSVPVQRRAVTQVRQHPQWASSAGLRGDAAVLTLATPLDLTGARARPIALGLGADAGLWDGLSGDRLVMSGWGGTQPTGGTTPDVLKTVTLPVGTDATCNLQYDGSQTPRPIGDQYDPPTMLCAGNGAEDTCFGDSGGPAALLVGDVPVLAGLTSFGGETCADRDHLGVYTEVSGIASFLDPAAQPPVRSRQPAVTGTPAPGQVLTCSPGAVRPAGAPSAVRFLRTDVTPAAQLAAGSTTYTVRPEDDGTRIACEVTWSNAAGTAVALSRPTAVVSASAVAEPAPDVPEPQPRETGGTTTPPPSTTTTGTTGTTGTTPGTTTAPGGTTTGTTTSAPPPTTPTPTTPTPQPQPQPQPAPADTASPVLRVSTTCTRTRCTYALRFSDTGGSGVAALVLRLERTVRVPCTRAGRRTTCARKTISVLRPRLTAAGASVAVARPTGRGTARLLATAVDAAGNRSRTSARTVARRR